MRSYSVVDLTLWFVVGGYVGWALTTHTSRNASATPAQAALVTSSSELVYDGDVTIRRIRTEHGWIYWNVRSNAPLTFVPGKDAPETK